MEKFLVLAVTLALLLFPTANYGQPEEGASAPSP